LESDDFKLDSRIPFKKLLVTQFTITGKNLTFRNSGTQDRVRHPSNSILKKSLLFTRACHFKLGAHRILNCTAN